MVPNPINVPHMQLTTFTVNPLCECARAREQRLERGEEEWRGGDYRYQMRDSDVSDRTDAIDPISNNGKELSKS